MIYLLDLLLSYFFYLLMKDYGEFQNVYVKDNIIEATVYGTEEYKVEIVKDNEEILDNDIQAMLDNNQLTEAFELTNYIFIRVGNQDMEYEEILKDIYPKELLDKYGSNKYSY